MFEGEILTNTQSTNLKYFVNFFHSKVILEYQIQNTYVEQGKQVEHEWVINMTNQATHQARLPIVHSIYVSGHAWPDWVLAFIHVNH